MRKKNIFKKFKCGCGCKEILFVDLAGRGTKDETLFIGSDNRNKTIKNFNGVLVNRKELLKILK